jgi:acid phosphatase type 7
MMITDPFLRPLARPASAALLRAIVISACLLAVVSAGEPAATSTSPRELPPLAHFRVTWMLNPATTALVSWTTPAQGASHVVYYDRQSRDGRLADYAAKLAALPARKYLTFPGDAGTPDGWAQNALLENLVPATTYHFVIASDGKVSREFQFRTAPADGRPFKLIYGADSRPARPDPKVPHLNRRMLNRLVAATVEQQPDIIALAHGGDYDSHAEWRFLREWLSDQELTIGRDGRILPIIPNRGNHEGREGHSTFEDMFFWPGRTTPYYYATELSDRATLITLNSNASKGGDQRDWLETELKRQRATPGKWIIVQYHVASYPSYRPVEASAAQRQHWVPLFEQYRVDLVCEADDHTLKRTVPIYEDKADPERGVIYIGDGGFGVPPRVPDTTRWYLQPPGFSTSALHFHVLDFTDGALRVTAIGLEGQTLDHFEVHAKSAASLAVP